MSAKSTYGRVVLAFVLGAIAFTVVVPAGSAQQEQQGRKIQKQVQPEYPELARRAHMSGTVKIQVIVTPNGTMKTTTPIGGNPVLIAAAVDALKSWRWEPATRETTELVQFRFEQ